MRGPSKFVPGRFDAALDAATSLKFRAPPKKERKQGVFMDSWFEATLRLPRISQFTDEEMQQHFWCLDGRWSQQTKSLVLKHAASGLNLNRNWAFS